MMGGWLGDIVGVVFSKYSFIGEPVTDSPTQYHLNK